MNIVFKEKYVNYNQISDVTLMDINNVLVDNGIFIELGDNSVNDWGGYSYYYCKQFDDLDEQTISSFVYIITWFMTSNPININPNFKSDKYYKNDKILEECLKIYSRLVNLYKSEVDLCKQLIMNIYEFYVDNHEDYIKKTEHMNCLLTYKEMTLFDKIEGKSRSDKLEILLDNYYK